MQRLAWHGMGAMHGRWLAWAKLSKLYKERERTSQIYTPSTYHLQAQ